jgi:hypothetical protein
MVRHVHVVLAAALVAASVAPLPAAPRRATPCPPGSFALDAASAAALAQLLGADAATLEVSEARDVRLGACAVVGRVTAKRKATKIAASWSACGGARKLRVQGTQKTPACTTISGTVKAKGTKRIRFTATRVPPTTTTSAPTTSTTTTTVPGPTSTTVPSTTTTTQKPATTTTFTFPSTTFTFPTSTNPGSTTTSTTLPPPAPGCGNGILDAGEPCEGLAGCLEGEVCTAACECEPASAPPATSQSLLAAALAKGEIDYPTSLLYRAWALFADSRLPPEYDGEAWQGQDGNLFLEIAAAWATLPQAIQDELTPFVTRPTEPGSYWHPGEPAAAGLAALAAEPASVECPYQPGAAFPDWRATETEHFVVWSCGGGDPNSDVDADRRTWVAAVAEQAYAAMVPEAGTPKGDSFASGPAPQDRIDVYLVAPRLCRSRGGSCAPLPLGDDGRPVLAAVATAPPCAPGPTGALAASSYMILDRERVTAPPASGPWPFRYTFAHEFFHVLANATNLEAQGGSCPGGQPLENVQSWLVEASAEWAAWAYFPADGPDDRVQLFRQFQQRPSAVSLRSLDGLHPYEAYLYPFFVQQETGSRAGFTSVWKAAEGAKTPAQLDDRLNQALPFEQHFRDFAVRNFNTDEAELPGDPLPLAQRHQKQDPVLPVNVRPVVLEPTVTLLAPTQFQRPANIAALSAQYERFAVDPATRWVKLDFQTLANSGFVQADVIANVGGTWERRRLPGLTFEFCRDDAADDISELYLVLSHHDRREGLQASGTYDVETRTVCPSGWTGTIRWQQTLREFARTTDPSGTETDEDASTEIQQWTFTGTTPAGAGVPFDVARLAWRGSWEKLREFRRTLKFGCLGQTLLSRTTGSGVGSGTHRVEMRPGPTGGWVFNVLELPFFPIEGTTSYYFYNCDGGTGSSTEPLENHLDRLYESLLAIGEGEMTAPDPSDPDHFYGSRTLIHFEDPDPENYEYLDVTVTWDIRRR